MNSSTRNTARLNALIKAWTELRPTKSFAGMTLAEFKTAVAVSTEARARLEKANQAAAEAIVDRDNGDQQTKPILERVIAGIVADAEEGNDGALFEAIGFVRKSDRGSGLTRRTVAPTSPAEIAKAA